LSNRTHSSITCTAIIILQHNLYCVFHSCRCQHSRLISGLLIIGVVTLTFALISILCAALNITGNTVPLTASGKFSPNESRTIQYSSTFCDSISIQLQNSTSSSVYNGTFSILSQPPELTGIDHIKFQGSPFFHYEDSTLHYWSFYLNEGSSITFSPCTEFFSFSSFSYYIIRGQESFEEWIESSNSDVAVKHGAIFSTCSSSAVYIVYNVTSGDDYFIAFYLLDGEDGTLTIDFDIHSAKYIPVRNTTISSCAVGNSTCSIKIPSSYSIGLLALSTTASVIADLSTRADINISCSQKAWVYVIIAFALAMLVLLVTSLIVCCFMYRSKQSSYQQMKGDTQDSSTNQISSPIESVSSYHSNSVAILPTDD